ncbi:uncharacterized protein I206_102447 [Kwoniella pini CBS 10737]|uniref:Uncharacterized protein n=1 Tax=Kwoniella pini CBS 10737 TaxID=1296096 RepID=A0A1B9I5H5_9TREE|nr:uncharacterized protein I206_02797 [Kwoniella pini CBS 10737]OCF50741.1 hypothetical protein I206_02797 [Kwoniella pini CBS 10737]
MSYSFQSAQSTKLPVKCESCRNFDKNGSAWCGSSELSRGSCDFCTMTKQECIFDKRVLEEYFTRSAVVKDPILNAFWDKNASSSQYLGVPASEWKFPRPAILSPGQTTAPTQQTAPSQLPSMIPPGLRPSDFYTSVDQPETLPTTVGTTFEQQTNNQPR